MLENQKNKLAIKFCQKLKIVISCVIFLLVDNQANELFSQVFSEQNYRMMLITVDKSGTGDFSSVTEAIQSLPDSATLFVTILVKKGVYKEKLVVPDIHTRILIKGENIDSTIITYDDFSGKIVGNDTLTTFGTCSVRIKADHFVAQDISFENNAGNVGQAVAIEINSDKVRFINCRFLGNQDTFFANSFGRIYLQNCYIEGTTDFIFGKSTVLFEDCVIMSKKDSYITAASTPEESSYGFVFKNCRLIAEDSVAKVHLGRPWRDYAKVVFIECNEGSHILPEGWHNWSKPWREKSATYAEYNCTGPGFKPTARVAWSHQLTPEEASKYISEKIFARQKSGGALKDDWMVSE